MLHKLSLPAALVVSLWLGGCTKLPDEPPLLATPLAPAAALPS